MFLFPCGSTLLITQENVAASRKSDENISQSKKEKTPELDKEKTSPPAKENTPQYKKETTPQPKKEKNPSPSKEKTPDCKKEKSPPTKEKATLSKEKTTTPPKEETTPRKEKTPLPKEKTPNKEVAPQFKQDNAPEKENSSQNSLLENIDSENKNNASQPKISDEGKAATKEITPQSTEVKPMTGSKKSGPMDHLPVVSVISATCNLPSTRP